MINTIKEIHDFKYYTGAHPEIKAHYRAGNRPTEFGNKVWATSLVLIDYLEKNPFKLEGLRVLEIGCGWGLLGVYLAKKYSCKVTCTDLDEYVLPIVQMQAEINGVKVETKKASFNDLTTEYLEGFDLVLGAEVCYSEKVGQDLIQLIKRAFSSKVEHFVIADPGRPDFRLCKEYCIDHYKTDMIQLPGSVNGKVTNLLSAYNQNDVSVTTSL